MEHYTRLTTLEIEAVSAKFTIHGVSSFKLLSGGSENTNYLITSESGKYVLSICEAQSAERAAELAHLLEHLRQNNFKTSEIIYTIDKKPILIWEGRPIIFKHYLEGEIQEDVSPPLLKMIGRELAKLNKIAAPDYLPKQLGYGKEQFGNVNNYAPTSEFNNWIKGIMEYISPYRNLDLPKSLIHCDLFWNNVLIGKDENSVVIIDFEEAAYYYRVFDVGMMIIGMCGEGETINLGKARHLLEGYQSETQLLEEELNSLKAFTIYAGATMSFWRHQNFNYLKPDPHMFDHYLGLKNLVDFMMRQSDDCFTKGIINT